MINLFEDTEIVRSTPARIASYSASYLEVGKSRRMACFIISLVEALSCNPSPTPAYHKAPSIFRIHQLELSDFVSC